MDSINSAISTINMGIRYLEENAWPIACLLAALYVVKTQCRLPVIELLMSNVACVSKPDDLFTFFSFVICHRSRR
jgi:hypothetical protein